MKVINKIVLFFLVFGMSIHASGLTYFISNNSSQNQFYKKESSLKKGDLSNLIDLQDNEIELDSEDEKNIDESSLDLINSFSTDFSIFKNINYQWANQCTNHSIYKLPLYIHFENYRL
ncbi:MAG: hypothetical protein ACKO7D_05785 [Bacteroidota bacterium]